jgi:hypothetical protein
MHQEVVQFTNSTRKINKYRGVVASTVAFPGTSAAKQSGASQSTRKGGFYISECNLTFFLDNCAIL